MIVLDHKIYFKNLIALISFLILSVSTTLLKAQSIGVNTVSYTPEQLVKDIFVGNANQSCITVDNISITGKEFSDGDKSWGYFNKASSDFAINDGIILSTGRARAAQGPNSYIQNEGDRNWLGDQDLIEFLTVANLDTQNILNATVLEFDFISYNSENITFDYMFLSEEYRSNNCQYSDAFAFLIKKADNTEQYKNIAVVPGTNIPVTSTTINGANNCRQNEEYFGGFNNNSHQTTNFNGQTKVLKAVANVEVGVKYKIKLVIADHGDQNGIYDSAVFLKGSSFIGSKDLGPDLTQVNGNALCPGGNYLINATEAGATKYTWYRDGVQISSGNFPTFLVDYNNAGFYEVEIELAASCQIKGKILIEKQILPILGSTVFSVCDDNFDGIITVNLPNYTNTIITNFNNNFNIKYFAQAPTNINNPTEDPITQLNFNGTSGDVWIWVKSGTCTPTLQKITFNKNGTSTFNTINPIEICDDLLVGEKQVDLRDYLSLLITNYQGSPTFFATRNEAENPNGTQITAVQTITGIATFYVRFHQAGLCDNIAELKFNLKSPKVSTLLKDKTICKGTTTTLDAGTGFDSYLWSYNNATTSSINNVPSGTYTVKLGSNGCFYTQQVTITEAADLVIEAIEINASTVTVIVSGGTAPYQYSLDGGAYQSSNVFTNVTLGNHIVTVISSENCQPISKEFSLIKVTNVITPNGDGHNDVIDYSELLNKSESRFVISNRYGQIVFEGSKDNNFIWNGFENNRPLPTGSYWYILEWKEANAQEKQQFKGWILLKNRN